MRRQTMRAFAAILAGAALLLGTAASTVAAEWRTGDRVVVGSGETISGDYMFVRELEIGGAKIKNLAIVFADAHTFKKLELERKPALLLGMNAIRAFKKVSIDFASRKFRVVLPETSQLDVRFASARLK